MQQVARDMDVPVRIGTRKTGIAVVVALALLATGLAGVPWAPEAAGQDPPPTAAFDWTMPPRFGGDSDGDGLVDYFTPSTSCTDTSPALCVQQGPTHPDPIDRETWRVDLDACDSTPGATLTWEVVDVDDVTVEGGPACDSYSMEVPRLGTYRVDLTAVTESGSTTVRREVVAQDWLIVSIGDSYGSGEGNPDLPLTVGDRAAANETAAELIEALADLADFGPCAPDPGFDFVACAEALDAAGDDAIDRAVGLITKLADPICAIGTDSFDLVECAKLLIEFGFDLLEAGFEAVEQAWNDTYSFYVTKFHQAYQVVVVLVDGLKEQLESIRLEGTWQEARCHRSAHAGSAQAARVLEEADPRTSVTFVHVACSGAEILTGILESYGGVSDQHEAVNAAALEPQLAQVRELIGDREIDALYVSLGGNDIGFGNLVMACILQDPCNPTFQGLGPADVGLIAEDAWRISCVGTGLLVNPILGFFCDLLLASLRDEHTPPNAPTAEMVFADGFTGTGPPNDPDDPEKHRIRNLYRDLNTAIRGEGDLLLGDDVDLAEVALGLPERYLDRVYISEYVDATRNDDGTYCPAGDPLRDLPGLDAGEAEWVDQVVETRLNQAIALSAAELGWNLVGGIYDAFQGHGYCAVDTYLVRIQDAFVTQGNKYGAVHPNRKGHGIYRNRILEAWLADLYPDPSGSAPAIPDTANPTSRVTARTVATTWVADHEPRRPAQGPIADAGGPFEVDEGSTIELLNDTWEPNGDQLEFLWTVTPATGVVEILDPTAAVPTLRGIDDGTATIDVVVSDVDGVSSASTSVTVDNVAPTVDAGPDVTLPEGALLDVAASFTDPGRLDTHEATVHWGDTTGADPVTVTDGTVPLAHVYADDGEYTVVVCVVDKDGGEGCDSLVVTVTNADPSVVVGTIGDGPEFFLPFVAVPVAASFNDPGTLDTHVARFAWGDGTESDGVVTEEPFGPPGSVDGLDGTVTGVHTYTAPGLYTLALTVTDKDGGVGQATAQVEVLSPAEAVARVLEQLEALAVDPAVDAQAVAALQEVLKHLGGPTDPSRSGAFHRLEDEDWAAAVRKLEQALHELARAAAADPALDLHLAQLVLTQVAESVATDIYGRAVAALDPPSRGEARQLERISSTIDAGRAARADGRWVDAAALFHDAVRRAMDLL